MAEKKPSSTYTGALASTTHCIPYKRGFLKFPHLNLKAIPAGVQQFYFLPKMFLEFFREAVVGHPYMFVLGLLQKSPILGVLEFNPYEYYNSHTLVTRYMESITGEFDIIMSGELMYDGDRIIFSDESGHFYKYFAKDMIKNDGAGYIKYINNVVKPILQMAFKGHPVRFEQFRGEPIIYKGISAPENRAEYMQVFRKRVCKQRDRPQNLFRIYPDERACNFKRYPGPDFCKSDDEIDEEVQKVIEEARTARQRSQRQVMQKQREQRQKTQKLRAQAAARKLTSI
jgi:hypothetical protein